jgi:hypothetical protein
LNNQHHIANQNIVKANYANYCTQTQNSSGMTTQYSYYHKIINEQKQKQKSTNNNVNFNIVDATRNTRSNNNNNNNNSRKPQIKSNRIIMKVKQLRRTWLVDSGDGGGNNIKNENNKNDNENNESESEYESFDLLGIESKSTESTSPSSTFVNLNNNCIASEGTASFSFDNYADELFGEEEEEYNGNDDDDISSPPSELYNKKHEMDHITSKNHLDLLHKQAPPIIAVVVKEEQEANIIGADGVNVDNDEEKVVGSDGSIHDNSSTTINTTSIVLRDQILTKETLDDMCRGDQYKSTFNDNDKQKQVSPTSSSHSPYGTPIAEDDNSFASSCFSQDSNDAPSIAPSVLVSKMANVFLNNHHNSTNAAGTHGGAINCQEEQQQVVPERRRYVDPKELSFLQSSSSLLTKDSGNYRGTKASIEINGQPKPLKMTSVSVGIRAFGGYQRKNLIERRKEQLNEKFEESKSAIFIKKKTWSICNSTGSYKRKIIVDKQYNNTTRKK